MALHEPEHDAASLLRAADDALLRAKRDHDLTLEEAGKQVGLSPSAARAAASRAYTAALDDLAQQAGLAA